MTDEAEAERYDELLGKDEDDSFDRELFEDSFDDTRVPTYEQPEPTF